MELRPGLFAMMKSTQFAPEANDAHRRRSNSYRLKLNIRIPSR
jgi:hypothetical protein